MKKCFQAFADDSSKNTPKHAYNAYILEVPHIVRLTLEDQNYQFNMTQFAEFKASIRIKTS